MINVCICCDVFTAHIAEMQTLLSSLVTVTNHEYKDGDGSFDYGGVGWEYKLIEGSIEGHSRYTFEPEIEPKAKTWRDLRTALLPLGALIMAKDTTREGLIAFESDKQKIPPREETGKEDKSDWDTILGLKA